MTALKKSTAFKWEDFGAVASERMGSKSVVGDS